jgi:hypothetical protein
MGKLFNIAVYYLLLVNSTECLINLIVMTSLASLIHPGIRRVEFELPDIIGDKNENELESDPDHKAGDNSPLVNISTIKLVLCLLDSCLN